MVAKSHEESIQNTLSLPKPKPLHENRKEAQFVCVGVDAFPLTNYMMKPYPENDFTIDNRIFNYCLSRARQISENAFGIRQSLESVAQTFFIATKKGKNYHFCYPYFTQLAKK